MDSLGTKLRGLRKSQRLSLKQLADRVGCTASYLSMVENDRLDPSVSRLKKIVDALGKTIVDLFGEPVTGTYRAKGLSVRKWLFPAPNCS